MNKGIWFGIGAYVMWGLFPIYWKWLQQVPALQLLSHRIVWSFITLLITIFLLHQWGTFRSVALKRRVLRIYLLAAILIGFNWGLYVWAVNAGFILETSLGYFINPLLNVLVGVIVLHERLRPLQWVAIGLAAVGVLYLAVVYGSLPWIALGLAFSFSFYGFVKKKAPLGSLYGLTIETGALFIPAVLYLMFSDFNGTGAFLHEGLRADLLMIGAGLVTTIPLLMFSSAAQRIPFSWVGILQYISPSLQFLIGALIYKETLSPARFIGYCIVWVALLAIGVDGLRARRAQVLPAPAE